LKYYNNVLNILFLLKIRNHGEPLLLSRIYVILRTMQKKNC